MWRTMCSGGRGLIPLGAALLMACGGELPSKQPGTVLPPTPLCAASDPAQVVAPQRIALLTSTQLMNMIRLVSDEAARSIVDGAVFEVTSDFRARFPPARFEPYKSIPDATSLSVFSTTAQKVGEYVRDHFAAVTTCPSPATEGCATSYLDTLAGKAYRRPLTADEQARFRSLYDSLRTAIVKDQTITLTVEEATGFAVQALLLSPQLLWRWEVGAETSSSPPGVFLTDAELASNLSFFLTDGPPDDALRADASAGTLRANLGAHVDRILATPAARQWLTHVMQTYFTLNQLPGVIIDESKFPIVAGGALYADLYQASQLFLGDVMWNGKVTDLLTSRKAFLNSNLASMIYGVPVPAGATATHFTETMLPADERAGMLTDAGFLTRLARATGVGIVPRGLGVKALFTCVPTPPPSDSLAQPGSRPLATWTRRPRRSRWRPGQRRPNAARATRRSILTPSCSTGTTWSAATGRSTTSASRSMGTRSCRRRSAVPRSIPQWSWRTCSRRATCSPTAWRRPRSTPRWPTPGWRSPSPLTSRRAAPPPAWRTTCDGARAESFTDLFRAAATSPAFVLRTVDASAAYDDTPADTGGSRSAPPVPGDPALANLAARRTVFDFVAQELDGLRRMRPTDVRAKLDNHYDAVGMMQSALTAAIDAFNSN